MRIKTLRSSSGVELKFDIWLGKGVLSCCLICPFIIVRRK